MYLLLDSVFLSRAAHPLRVYLLRARTIDGVFSFSLFSNVGGWGWRAYTRTITIATISGTMLA